MRSTAPDGVCTSTAIYFGEQPALPLLEMYTKGITFKTGRANAREAMPHVFALAAAGALQPERVTTRTVAWGDAAEALLERDWMQARDRALTAGRPLGQAGRSASLCQAGVTAELSCCTR